MTPNPAVNRTLRDKAAQRRLLLRWASMTRIRSLLAAAICASCFPVVAQQCDRVSWNRQLTLSVSPEAKHKAVLLLTHIAKQNGWVAVPANGLDELNGRATVFLSFGRNRKDMLLTVTDVLKPTELLVRAYYEASIPGAVEGVVAEFTRGVASISGIQLLEDRSCLRPS